jgi:hypothetical protein
MNIQTKDEPIYRDKNGRQIFAGDLVRSKHFKDRRGKQHYLYHGIVRNEKYGVLEMVPVTELCGAKPNGGRCWLLAIAKDGYADTEILYGRDQDGVSYDERPRVKQQLTEAIA